MSEYKRVNVFQIEDTGKNYNNKQIRRFSKKEITYIDDFKISFTR